MLLDAGITDAKDAIINNSEGGSNADNEDGENSQGAATS